MPWQRCGLWSWLPRATMAGRVLSGRAVGVAVPYASLLGPVVHKNVPVVQLLLLFFLLLVVLVLIPCVRPQCWATGAAPALAAPFALVGPDGAGLRDALQPAGGSRRRAAQALAPACPPGGGRWRPAPRSFLARRGIDAVGILVVGGASAHALGARAHSAAAGCRAPRVEEGALGAALRAAGTGASAASVPVRVASPPR